ncbi:poly-beta-1,6-N-acetyl-D-glucosamine biosynthesis protein PgaD [Thioalkalivibrio sp. XN8]|uniref:poly-beta-1,6-N-acetyl-D-glucosamine biosynthesis protein PgaD n=1 Tax=Thioalkalivibrio sp. XN8 TaxID=2712863 RepID=UPI0013EC5A17|nr:poly-beta-1,6-N-acetyl-D-glucosamine biosynthesis protein PgaD [Thioalkalivibrio sp. XN8]
MTTPRPLRHPEILYRPELQPVGQRTLYSVLTLIAWTVWLYLFVPLISLLAWWFGIDAFSRHLLEPADRSDAITLLGYAGVVVLSAVVIVAWSFYNLQRYGGLDRRKPISPVSDEDLRARHGIDAGTLAALRGERRMVLHLDPELRVETLPAVTPPECATPVPDRCGPGS